MVSVPRYQPGQAQLRRAPAFQISADIPAAAVGGGQEVASAAQALGDLGGAVTQIYLKEREKARDVATSDYSAQVAQLETETKIGIEKFKGKDALDAAEQGLADFDSAFKEMDKGIKDPEVRRRVRVQYQQYRDRVNGWAQPYAAGQMREYSRDVTKARVTTEFNAAFNDPSPTRINDALAVIYGELRAQGERDGESPEVLMDKFATVRSKLHVAIIGKFLSEGDTQRAQAYFNEVSGKPSEDGKSRVGNQIVDPEDFTKTQRALEIGNFQTGVDNEVERLLAIFNLDDSEAYSAAKEEVKNIKDDKKRHAVMGALEAERTKAVAEQDRIETETTENLIRAGERAKAAASAGGKPANSLEQIFTPVEMVKYEELSAAKRETIKKFIFTPVVNNDAMYLGADTFFKADADLYKFAKENPAEYLALVSNFDEEHRKKFDARRAAGQKSVANTEQQDVERREKDAIENAIVYGEIFYDRARGKESKTIDDFQQEKYFREAVQTRKEQFIAKNNGRNPDADEFRALVGGALSETVIAGRSLKRVVDLSAAERRLVGTEDLSSKQVDEVISTTSEASQKYMLGILRKEKKSASREMMARLFLAYRLDDKARFMELLRALPANLGDPIKEVPAETESALEDIKGGIFWNR